MRWWLLQRLASWMGLEPQAVLYDAAWRVQAVAFVKPGITVIVNASVGYPEDAELEPREAVH